eukprot:SAG31_NODE_2139_length_6349_cov_2.773636_4_plen_82_part_00
MRDSSAKQTISSPPEHPDTVVGGEERLGARGTGHGGGAGLLRTQLFWSLRTGARGRPGAAGVAAAAKRATRGSGGVGAVNV